MSENIYKVNQARLCNMLDTTIRVSDMFPDSKCIYTNVIVLTKTLNIKVMDSSSSPLSAMTCKN